jgi:hypothetical protein
MIAPDSGGIEVVIDRMDFDDPDISPARATHIGALVVVEMRRLLEQQGLSTIAGSEMLSAQASTDPRHTDRQIAGDLARGILNAVRGS